MCYWQRKIIWVVLWNNKHQPGLLRNISEHSHCKQSKSTHQDAQLLTFIMENYSQQKCHLCSVQILVIINIFISLLSFLYTCGVLDHTDFFTCADRWRQKTEFNFQEHRAKLTRTLSRLLEKSIKNFLQHFQWFFPFPKIHFPFLPEDPCLHTLHLQHNQ